MIVKEKQIDFFKRKKPKKYKFLTVVTICIYLFLSVQIADVLTNRDLKEYNEEYADKANMVWRYYNDFEKAVIENNQIEIINSFIKLNSVEHIQSDIIKKLIRNSITSTNKFSIEKYKNIEKKTLEEIKKIDEINIIKNYEKEKLKLEELNKCNILLASCYRKKEYVKYEISILNKVKEFLE